MPKTKTAVTDVREFRNDDFDAVVVLLNTVLPDEQPHNDPATSLTIKAETDNLIFVATDSEVVCGFIMAGYDGHRGWLYQLAVHPSVRRNGVATRLVQLAIDRLRELGCRKLNLQVREGNQEAEQLYLALGFTVEQRTSLGLLI